MRSASRKRNVRVLARDDGTRIFVADGVRVTRREILQVKRCRVALDVRADLRIDFAQVAHEATGRMRSRMIVRCQYQGSFSCFLCGLLRVKRRKRRLGSESSPSEAKVALGRAQPGRGNAGTITPLTLSAPRSARRANSC